jgi:hypothetical protein
VIDAAKFATAYTAFWNTATPICEHFVRKLNTSLYTLICPPIKNSQTKDRALIAEMSFALFDLHSSGKMTGAPQADIEIAAEKEARRHLLPFLRQGLVLPVSLDAAQTNEVRVISNRLRNHFKRPAQHLAMRPVFSGCGLIDKSEGDLIYGNVLYEVKTVDRPFRSSDVRQLLAYAALNHFSGQFPIACIGVFNPRRGVSFDAKIDDVAREVCGRPPSFLFDEIAQVTSSGEISR